MNFMVHIIWSFWWGTIFHLRLFKVWFCSATIAENLPLTKVFGWFQLFFFLLKIYLWVFNFHSVEELICWVSFSLGIFGCQWQFLLFWMTNSISRKCGCILQLTHRGRRFSCWNRSSLLDFHADWNLHWSFVTFGNVFYESGLYMSCASSFLNFPAPSYIVHFVFVHPSECCHWQGGHCSSAFWRHLGFVFELLLFDFESSMGTLLPWESPGRVKNSSKFLGSVLYFLLFVALVEVQFWFLEQVSVRIDIYAQFFALCRKIRALMIG